MIAPSQTLSSLLVVAVVSCVVIGLASGQQFRGPGYLACPIADIADSSDCEILPDFNCTDAQIDVCNATEEVGESVNEDLTIAYLPLFCECVIAEGCPDSCEFFTDDIPTLPPVAGYVNYTGFGNVTCPLADLIATPDPCYPFAPDPSSCGSCNATIVDDNFGIAPGDTTITFPLVCECLVLINCPDTCTFVATDGPAEVPVAAPVATAPTTSTTTETPVAAPTTTTEDTDTPVSAPTSDEGNVTAPVAAPTSDKGNVTTPTRPVSAPRRSPVATPSSGGSTSVATTAMTTSYKISVMTVVLTMMYVLTL